MASPKKPPPGPAQAAPPAPHKKRSPPARPEGHLGFEATLWATADKLRGNLDAAEYKHVVLGLIFLKYISDAFEEKHAALQKEKGADPEDRDEYLAENVFWVPPEARWSYIKGRAKDPLIGKLLDSAMIAIERDNPSLKNTLPKDYTRPHLDKQRLGEVVDLISNIGFRGTAHSGEESNPADPHPRPLSRERGNLKHYRGGFDFSGLVKRARELRRKQTPAEKILWELLRDRRCMDFKFRRQHQVGEYLLDFCCVEASLVVETDGAAHGTERQRKHDHKRDAYLRSVGFSVLRFTNDQVLESPEVVLEKISSALFPSPSGRGARGEGHGLGEGHAGRESATGEGHAGRERVDHKASDVLPSPSGRGVRGEGHGGRERARGEGHDRHESARGEGHGVDHKTSDVLGRVYEYFLSQFASAEGKKGGQFYTPRCVVQLLVEMLAPYKGRVFDPCCGSGGMFVQSVEFLKAHATGNGNGPPAPHLRQAGGKAKGDLSIFGQESNPTTWRLAKMNLAIRGIEGDLGDEPADSFHRDLHKDLKADYILANPPFNMSDWGGDHLREDLRWKFGAPPAGNANFAWVQHFIHHLAPTGAAGFVLANGSMSSNQSGEGQIRQAIVEADLVDCMVALPGQLFYSTQIPVCLWFLTRSKAARVIRHANDDVPDCLRHRRGETLFIDARKMGKMTDRVHRELTEEDISTIADTYHNWRQDWDTAYNEGEKRGILLDLAPYRDKPGFCKSAKLEEIRAHGFVLTPGRYVGAEEIEGDGEPLDQKMKRLTAKLEEQFTESAKLEQAIRANLKGLGYAG